MLVETRGERCPNIMIGIESATSILEGSMLFYKAETTSAMTHFLTHDNIPKCNEIADQGAACTHRFAAV